MLSGSAFQALRSICNLSEWIFDLALITDGRAYTASSGYLELCRILGGWWHAFRISAVIPERLRYWLYALIARHRYSWFGKVDFCALLTKEQRERLL